MTCKSVVRDSHYRLSANRVRCLGWSPKLTPLAQGPTNRSPLSLGNRQENHIHAKHSMVSSRKSFPALQAIDPESATSFISRTYDSCKRFTRQLLIHLRSWRAKPDRTTTTMTTTVCKILSMPLAEAPVRRGSLGSRESPHMVSAAICKQKPFERDTCEGDVFSKSGNSQIRSILRLYSSKCWT